ncbi:MAG: hypothetical protein N2044_09650 [Cyclobacteriaceae bacterium]|nr:hypothetical protein [Cyclobacteriaceae bacterium]MDW8331605.1 hypothetical protein [Cyclobacteriaceae bacterium]
MQTLCLHAQSLFDVLIKLDGSIVTGKVIEVNLKTIKYQRLDMVDGPVMEIPRNTVYAITYRNQQTEYLLPVDSTSFYQSNSGTKVGQRQPDTNPWHAHIDSGRIQIGVGIIRSFSLIRNVESLANKKSLPAFVFGYFFPVKRNVDIGLIAGFGSFKYEENRVSQYDLFQITRNIKENILNVSVTCVYRMGFKTFDPYLMGGLAFYNSRANSEGMIRFLDDGRTITVENSAAGSSFGFLVRGGVSVNINSKSGAYFDVGNGITLLQFGGFVKLDLK